MQKGDIIIKVGNKNIKEISELQEELSKYRPGDKINIFVKRAGKTKKLSVTLKNQLGNTKILKSSGITIYGARFEEVPSYEKEKRGFS